MEEFDDKLNEIEETIKQYKEGYITQNELTIKLISLASEMYDMSL
jgi:hypothetical protein